MAPDTKQAIVRVAIDARLLAYQSAGIATYIRGILGGLREGKVDADIVVLESRKASTPADGAYGAVRRLWTPCHHRWERWALGVELATLPVDVVHSPDFIPPSRLGRRWARVITVHDLAFLRFPELLTAESQRYYHQIARAVGEAERVIAVSEATRRDLIELVDPGATKKVVVVPEGVDSRFQPRDRDLAFGTISRRFNLRRPFFLFVGTREPRKNLARLARAFARFQERIGPDQVDLVLAGSRGWLADDLDALLEPMGDSVHCLGRVTDDELVDLYNAAISLVFVSLYEGFGLPALEAMACGQSAIVADRGALPELVGDAGLLVNPEDEAEIASALERMWHDRALRACLRERAEQRATGYTWATAAKRTAAVYRQAVACVS